MATCSHELTDERDVDAPPGAVFDALTSPEGQPAMFESGPPGSILESESDVRVGGAWPFAFGPSRAELYRIDHVFRAIERPRRIAVDVTEAAPGGQPFASAAETMLQERDDRTRLVFRQRFPTAELRDGHRLGVPSRSSASIASSRRETASGRPSGDRPQQGPGDAIARHQPAPRRVRAPGRARLPTGPRRCLERMAGFIEEQARAGDPGARRLASSGAPGKRRHDDLRYLEQHRAAFELALQTTQ